VVEIRLRVAVELWDGGKHCRQFRYQYYESSDFGVLL
jgi:hypothetical protein